MPADINVDDELKNAATAKVGPKELQQSSDQTAGFLRGLMDAFKMGAQNTGYAIRDDLTDLQERHLPHNFMHDIGGLLTMADLPMFNTRIGSAMVPDVIPGPAGANQFVMQMPQKLERGGDWAQNYARSGGFGVLPEVMYRMLERAKKANTLSDLYNAFMGGEK